MNTVIKCILPAILSVCMYPGFAQKVLILRNTITESNNGNVYLQHGPFEEAVVFHRNSHDELVIPLNQDSVFIYGRDESMDNMFKDTGSYRPPSYYISHISLFPADTIILSGVSFEDYFYQRTLTADSSWIKTGDKATNTKSIYISPDAQKKLPESLPYPDIKINGAKAGKRLTLSGSTGTSNSTAMANGVTTKYTYETLYFTFKIDLGKSPK